MRQKEGRKLTIGQPETLWLVKLCWWEQTGTIVENGVFFKSMVPKFWIKFLQCLGIRKTSGMVLPVEALFTSYWDPSKPWRDYVMGTRRVHASPREGSVCVWGHSCSYWRRRGSWYLKTYQQEISATGGPFFVLHISGEQLTPDSPSVVNS